ncbi:NAD(P)/FAD-dependent oxidoreductase [Microbacterium ureisolvens]|uniref:NAD(P)/FAD-dependent oxidoreductase n=1 Tax=Microbacterium ureisolvens TaxID=2781186 RepID=UPI00362C6E7C
MRVVMLGGGYVTLHAYATLARRTAPLLRNGELEIVVISADTAHRFHGFTGELVAGMIGRDRVATPLAEAMPLARIVEGVALSIDAAGQTVSYRRGEGAVETLRYDHLVVGTGAREPVSEVSGLSEYGRALRGPDEIAALADHLATAPGSPVVVAGGGIAGVELAAAIADRGHPTTLVHSGDRIIPEWSDQPGLVARAAAELDRLGVRVITGVRLTEVTATAAVLSDGSSLPAATVVAATGQRPVRIPGLDPWRDERGRLLTQPTLAVRYGVWAAGDGARVGHPVTGEPVPANALWAMKGGDHIGRAIARRLDGRSARRFAYRGLGRAASFGFGRGISELYGVPFTGAIAWMLRLVFFLRFMPSPARAAGIVADLSRFAFTPRVPVAASAPEPVPALP